MADNLRISLNEYEVITMAQFIRRSLAKEEIKSKEELLLILGNVWKKVLPQSNFSNFLNAYNLFSELTSHTLDLLLLQEILDDFDTELIASTTMFWQTINDMGIIDEQRAYSLIDIQGQSIMLAEFTFFSAIQIDMINRISQKNDIYLPCPKEIFEKRSSFDWMSWLDPNHKIVFLESSKKRPTKKTCITFPKNNLGSILQRILLEDDDLDIILGSNNFHFNYINEIPTSNKFFKTSISFLDNLVARLFREIVSEVSSYRTDNLKIFLENKIKAYIKDYRYLKIWITFYQTFKQWIASSKQNQILELGLFDLKLIEYISLLKMPRVFLIPLAQGDFKGVITTLDNLPPNYTTRRKIICISSDYDLRLQRKNLPFKLISKLSTLGPVRRDELHLQFLRCKMKNILLSDNLLLLMEEDLLKENHEWNEIIGDIDFMKEDSKFALQSFSITDFFSSYQGKNTGISATRIQTYIDCPRKYWATYIKKISSKPKIDCHLKTFELGTLEHQIIGLYLTNHKNWDQNKHNKMAKEHFDKHLNEQNQKLGVLSYQQALHEVLKLTSNGIKFLLEFKNFNFTFEMELGRGEGFIDLLLENDNGQALIDFKRSKSSIPSIVEFLNFSKIALWYYLSRIPTNNLFFFGYLNLKDPQNSLFFTKDFSYRKVLGRTQKIDDNFMNKMNEYRLWERAIINQLTNNKEYKINPRNSSICDYCFISNVCVRDCL